MHHRSILIGAVSIMALSNSAALAQSSQGGLSPAAQTPATAVDGEGGNSIADIIVTANKRSESIDKVPLAITAVTGGVLKEQGVTSVQDLSRLVPGLVVTQATFGTDVYTIRGVGFYDTTLAAIPAVSVYVDEVPLPFSVMTKGASLDPERVEVLMGPQGTLFGENSTGGAINYIAAKPTKDFAAGLTSTFGNYGTYNADGYVSGPLSSTLGARLSFRSLNSENGWQKSVSRDDRLGKVDQQQARLLLDWKPTDRLSFLLNANGFLDRSDTQAPRYLGYILSYPTLASRVPQLINASPTTGDGSFADWDPDVAFEKNNKFYQVSLRGDYSISDNLTVTNIAAYSHYDHDQFQEGDGLPITVINQRVVGRISNFSDELRLSGDLTDRLKFILGGSYRHGAVSQHDFGYVDNYTASYLPTLLGVSRWRVYENLSDQKIRSLAIFGNLDYDITDKFALHAGARYTNGKTNLNSCSTGDAGVTALARSTNAPGECLTLLATGVSGAVVDTSKEDNVSWRVGIDYKPIRGVLLYANVSRGFKAGGYPVLPATNYLQLSPASQEQLTSYEIGFKANVAGRALRLNGAVFNYEYVDKQILGRQVVPVFGGLSKLLNIPKSNLKGAELNLQWRPFKGLNLNGGFSYIQSNIRNYSTYDVANVIVDLDGASFPNAPSFRGNVSAQYDWSVSGALNAFVGTDYSYTSRTRGTLGFTPQLDIPNYGLLGLRAGVREATDKWRLSLWARNLTDKSYLVGTNRDGEALISFTGLPRTYGASFTVNFR